MRRDILVAGILFKNYVGSFREQRKLLAFQIFVVVSQIPVVLSVFLSGGHGGAGILDVLERFGVDKYLIAALLSFFLSLLFWIPIIRGQSRIRIMSAAEYSFLLSQPIEVDEYVVGRAIFGGVLAPLVGAVILFIYLPLPVALLNLPLWRIPLLYAAFILLLLYAMLLYYTGIVITHLAELVGRKRILRIVGALWLMLSVEVGVLTSSVPVFAQLLGAPVAYLIVGLMSRSFFPFFGLIALSSVFSVSLVLFILRRLSRGVSPEIVTLIGAGPHLRDKTGKVEEAGIVRFAEMVDMNRILTSKIFIDLKRYKIFAIYKYGVPLVATVSLLVRFLGDLVGLFGGSGDLYEFWEFMGPIFGIVIFITIAALMVGSVIDEMKCFWIYRSNGVNDNDIARIIFVKLLLVGMIAPLMTAAMMVLTLDPLVIAAAFVVVTFYVLLMIPVMGWTGVRWGTRVKVSPLSPVLYYTEEVQRDPALQFIMMLVMAVAGAFAGLQMLLFFLVISIPYLIFVVAGISVLLVVIGERILRALMRRVEMR